MRRTRRIAVVVLVAYFAAIATVVIVANVPPPAGSGITTVTGTVIYWAVRLGLTIVVGVLFLTGLYYALRAAYRALRYVLRR